MQEFSQEAAPGFRSLQSLFLQESGWLTSTLRLSSSSSATRAAMASRRTLGTSSSCCATASSMMGPPTLQMLFLHSSAARLCPVLKSLAFWQDAQRGAETQRADMIAPSGMHYSAGVKQAAGNDMLCSFKTPVCQRAR